MSDVEFHQDGTISVYLTGDTGCRLNRPTMGAYRKLRASMVDLNEQIAALQRTRQDQTRALAKWEQDGAKGKQPAVTSGQQIEEASEALLEQWWRQAFALLSPGSALPDSVDDWPVFMFYGEGILARMLNHWRSVPLPSTVAE